MSSPPTHPRIPYGEADFKRIRLNRWLYVDKTRFVRWLEDGRYAFLIRPRRFGKSLWISLLENYYDRFWPTTSRPPSPAPTSGSTRPGNKAATSPCASTFQPSTTSSIPWSGSLRAPVSLSCRGRWSGIPTCFPKPRCGTSWHRPPSPPSLSALFLYAGDHGIPLYVLIDEYDNLPTRCWRMAPR